MNQSAIHRIGNIFGLVFILFILTLTFIDEFLAHDIPCPLCLLQRIGMIGIGIGFVMNFKIGIKIDHYGLMLFAALLGLATAGRQIYLHREPYDLGFGKIYLGHHLYIWSTVVFGGILFSIAIALLFDKGFNTRHSKTGYGLLTLMLYFLFLIIANGISTFVGWISN